MTLLLNKYPPTFIFKYFNRFFELNNAVSVLKQLDAQAYQESHQKLLNQPTRREKELRGVATDRDQIPEKLRKFKPWNPNILYAKYKFESAPRLDFPKTFRMWWHEHFVHTESNAAHVAVKLSIKNNQTLEKFFVHKKPPREMLRKR